MAGYNNAIGDFIVFLAMRESKWGFFSEILPI
jgi:hypothetical protein